MRPREPPLGDLRLRPWRPQAHRRDSDYNADQRPAPQRPRPILKRSFGLQNQPARAEQAVAEDQGDASEQRERREAVKRAASEMAAFCLKALNERAKPLIVPYKFTLWDAASSQATQAFFLVGTVFLLPIILMYTGWSYWVFRGKVRGDLGYH